MPMYVVPNSRQYEVSQQDVVDIGPIHDARIYSGFSKGEKNLRGDGCSRVSVPHRHQDGAKVESSPKACFSIFIKARSSCPQQRGQGGKGWRLRGMGGTIEDHPALACSEAHVPEDMEKEKTDR